MADSHDVYKPKRKPTTKNYGLEGSVNVVFAVITYLICEALATHYLGYPLVGKAIGGLAAALSIIYFGWAGFRKIPVAFRGVPLIFGTRQEGYELDEGLVWNWPEPIGGLEIVDVREQTLNVNMTEVLTHDNVPVVVNLSAQYRPVNLFDYLSVHNVSNALEEAIDNNMRIMVQEIESHDVAQEKKNMPEKILKGFQTTEEGAEKQWVEGIAQYAAEQWGIEVIKIRITHIRLPEAMEAAQTAIKVQEAETKREEAQKTTEMVEAKHVAELMAIYKETGLSPEFAANMAQTERQKATRIIIDGSASRLEKVGVATAVLNNQPSSPATPQASTDEPGFKNQRKRKGE